MSEYIEIDGNQYAVRGDKVFKKHGDGEKLIVNEAKIEAVKAASKPVIKEEKPKKAKKK